MTTRLALASTLALALLLAGAWLLLRTPRSSTAADAVVSSGAGPVAQAPVAPAVQPRSERQQERDAVVEPAAPGAGAASVPEAPGPASTLRVLDALSGADLRAVVVLEGVPAYRGRIAPPRWSAENVVVADGASPLELPAREGVVEYWVGARGFGWQPLEVDHEVGGEREVRLPPAATVEVFVDGPREGLDLEVRLYPAEEDEQAPGGRRRTLAQVAPDANGRAVIEGLQAGSYELCAEVGMWYDPPHVLAREPLELVAGDHSQVVLHLAHPLLDAGPAPLAGELVLPAGHEQLGFTLRILPAGRAALRMGDSVRLTRADMQPVLDRPGVLRFDAGELTPGLYAAVVDPLQWLELFELPEDGLRDLRLVLPELAEVQVDVVDAVTNEPLALERIAWGVRTPAALRTWSFENVAAGAVPGRFVWRAPPGGIEVVAGASGYREASQGLRVEPGGTETRIAMQPLFGVRVTFLDGKAVVPASWSHSELSLRRLGEQDALVHGPDYDLEMDDDARWRVLVGEPGWYVLTLPELPGFVRTDPVELELRSGALRELEVPLVRAP